MENEKIEKRKTSAPRQLISLGADVFRYAKSLIILNIYKFQWAKCFFPKMKIFPFWPINLLWIEHFLPDLAEILCVTSLCIHLCRAGVISFPKKYLTWFFILFFIWSEIWENCCNAISQRYRCINNSFCDPNLLQKLRMTPLQLCNKFLSSLMQTSSILVKQKR